jgi:TonB family protein
VSRGTTTFLLLTVMAFIPLTKPLRMSAQQSQNEDLLRRAKTRVQPTYPDLARRMNISGTVKIEVVIAPNGTVKDARVLGGHPVLAGAALDAAKKWRFEPAPAESTGVIDFKFQAQ